ncbi:YfiR family protein, partial [Candidatus Venteria ishoeyi]
MHTTPNWLQLLLILVLTFASPSSSVLAANKDEYTNKARHLYQFARHIQWPRSSTLLVCVIGPDPFGKKLDQFLQGKRIGGRKLIPKRLSGSHQVSGCHMLFISGKLKSQQITKILTKTKGKIITVGEVPGFIQKGG